MGKKQHQKDKLYLTTTEWKESFGGHKDDKGTRIQRAQFKRLPLSHCALSLLPFEDPVCSPDGYIFDLTYIVPYLKKHGKNPCTGEKLQAKDLVHLKFAKDEEGGPRRSLYVSGNFRCPVTFRTFTDNSHVVAIRQTGNVYSMESVQELNLKRNHLKDLLTDEPFQRKDIIHLQDPNNLERLNMEMFRHVQLDTKTKAEIEKEKKEMQKPEFYIRSMNNDTRAVLDKLKKEYVPKEQDAEDDETADELNAAVYSQGKMAAGFTSTAMAPVTKQKAAVLSAQEVRYARVKKNGYIRIVTNYGPLNLELFCKQAPKACENFITHCRNGYYNNTKFYRIVRNFMMQGGDPTNTGKGGESIWGKPFEDEYVPGLSHNQRGLLSMANKGPGTNQSQFFVTFRPCKYLDKRHTIFGRLVGGMDTLTDIERVECEIETGHPFSDVIFLRSEVFVDPFEEAQAEIDAERETLKKKKVGEPSTSSASTSSANESKGPEKPKAYGTGIGKYIAPAAAARKREEAAPAAESGAPMKKKKVVKSGLSDFSSW